MPAGSPRTSRLTPPSATRATRRPSTPTRTPTPTRTSILRYASTTRQPTPTRQSRKTPPTSNVTSPTPTKSKLKRRSSGRTSAIPRMRVNTSTTIASTKTNASSVTSVTSPSSSTWSTTWSSVPASEQHMNRQRETFRKAHANKLEITLRKDDSIEEADKEDELAPVKQKTTPANTSRQRSSYPFTHINNKQTIAPACTPSTSLSSSSRRTSEPLFRTLDLLEQKWKQHKVTSPIPNTSQPTRTISAPPSTTPTADITINHLSSLTLAAARGRRRSTSENKNTSKPPSMAQHYELLEQKWRKQKNDSPLLHRSTSLPLTSNTNDTPPRFPNEKKKTRPTNKTNNTKKTVPFEATNPPPAPPIKVVKALSTTPPKPPITKTQKQASSKTKPPKLPPLSPLNISLRRTPTPPRALSIQPTPDSDDNSSVSTLSYDSTDELPPSNPSSSQSVFDRLYTNAPRLPTPSTKQHTSNCSVGFKSIGMESKGNVSKGVSSLDRRSFGKYWNSKRESKIPSFTGRR